MQPTNTERSTRLIVFDLDGTLLEAESSWGTVNDFFENDNSETLQLFRSGAIDYPECMRRDVAAWPNSLHISRIRDALSGWILRPGAEELLETLHEWGIETAILSGGIDVLASQVAAQLGIEQCVANELITDERGFLTGESRMRVDPLRKEIALAQLCRERNVALERCVTIGDSEMDGSFLRASGLGVLLGDAETAEALGVQSMSALSQLVELIASQR
jgi:phosphoserine phosphatase